MAVRLPAVAGQFYPDDPTELARDVDALLHASNPAPCSGPLHGVIVPHAGYTYSGGVAGIAYGALRDSHQDIHTVLLVGPAHHVYLEGLGTSSAQIWRTPLGDVWLATDEAEQLINDFADVRPRDDAHEFEHSLEVQLPFLQRILAPGWQLLPLVVGHASTTSVSGVLGHFLCQSGVVVVVSTDLSHYLPYEDAKLRDATTAGRIVECQAAEINDDDACGAYPLRGFLDAVVEAGCHIEQLAVASSGDSHGSHDRVVGYGAFAVCGGEPGGG